MFHSCWWIPILSTPEIVFYFQESQGPCASNSPSTAITLSRNGQGIDRQDIDDATRGGGAVPSSFNPHEGREARPRPRACGGCRCWSPPSPSYSTSPGTTTSRRPVRLSPTHPLPVSVSFSVSVYVSMPVSVSFSVPMFSFGFLGSLPCVYIFERGYLCVFGHLYIPIVILRSINRP